MLKLIWASHLASSSVSALASVLSMSTQDLLESVLGAEADRLAGCPDELAELQRDLFARLVNAPQGSHNNADAAVSIGDKLCFTEGPSKKPYFPTVHKFSRDPRNNNDPYVEVRGVRFESQ